MTKNGNFVDCPFGIKLRREFEVFEAEIKERLKYSAEKFDKIEDELERLEEVVDMLYEKNFKMMEDLRKEINGNWRKFLFFLLGIFATTLVNFLILFLKLLR